MSKHHLYYCLMAVWISLSACSTPRLLGDATAGNLQNAGIPPAKEHELTAGDKITLSIWGHEDLGVGSTFSVYSSDEAYGKYLILDTQGNIKLPMLGEVKLSGLNLREANLYLEKRFAEYIKEPIIYLNLLNRKVTLLGEIQTPGNYKLEGERPSLLEIIGQAGGFTDYADLSQVTVIRKDQSLTLQKYVIDLSSHETDIGQLYNLQSRDVIEIPALNKKRYDQTSGRLIPLAGVLGSIALLYSVFAR